MNKHAFGSGFAPHEEQEIAEQVLKQIADRCGLDEAGYNALVKAHLKTALALVRPTAEFAWRYRESGAAGPA